MTKAAHINLLLPAGREVYHLRRGLTAADADTGIVHPCVRCGSTSYAQSGGRRATYFSVRDQGSSFKNLAVMAIHNNCVPDGTEVVGIPASRTRGRIVS